MVIHYDPEWENEVRDMNVNKVGAPFQFSDTLIMLAAALRVALDVKFRQLEGMISEMLKGHDAPTYTALWRRINSFDTTKKGDMVTVRNKGSRMFMVIDASGLKQSNRGEWIRVKWKIRRGFVKLHIIVDIETRRIIAAAVTDESVGDSTMFSDLLGASIDVIQGRAPMGLTFGIKNHAEAVDAVAVPEAVSRAMVEATSECITNMAAYMDDHATEDIATDMLETADDRDREFEPLGRNLLAAGVSPLALLPGNGNPGLQACIFGDGAYGSRANIAMCTKAGIAPYMLHRINVTARGKGTGDAWGDTVRDQLAGSRTATCMHGMSKEEKKENQIYWKARLGYRDRWTVEFIFSAFKRLFREHLTARKWENMVQEVRLKILLYNKWIDEGLAMESAGAA